MTMLAVICCAVGIGCCFLPSPLPSARAERRHRRQLAADRHTWGPPETYRTCVKRPFALDAQTISATWPEVSSWAAAESLSADIVTVHHYDTTCTWTWQDGLLTDTGEPS